MPIKTKLLLLCILVTAVPTHSQISFVYNLKIAETTKRIALHSPLAKRSLATCVALGTFRKQYNGTKQNCGGALFTLAYAPENFFLRVDGAVAKVTSHSPLGIHSARTQTDDLLFTAGFSPKLSENRRFTYSALVGFPTHKDTSLERAEFGLAHYAVGAQMDGSFIFPQNEQHSLRLAARCIHFFPRGVNAQLPGGIIKPVRFNLGDLTDLYLAFHTDKERHAAEAGYNASFIFNATLCPLLIPTLPCLNAQIIKSFVRNSFYGVYYYRFLARTTPNILTTGFSYGFDSPATLFNNKQILTIWGSWSVNF